MTREDAIAIMEDLRLMAASDTLLLEKDFEAIDMAIEALKAQKSYELKNELPNHFSNACDLCVHKNVMCNICMTADKWEPKLNSSKSNSEDIQ